MGSITVAGAPVSPELSARHQIEQPTLASARTALQGFLGPHTDDMWRTLLFSAGLTGEETDLASVQRLIGVMQGGGSMVRLCARGLSVRVTAYDRLSRQAGAPGA